MIRIIDVLAWTLMSMPAVDAIMKDSMRLREDRQDGNVLPGWCRRRRGFCPHHRFARLHAAFPC